MGQVGTVTIAAVNYSVYSITATPVTDADQYLNAKIGAAAWAATSADDKARALVSAARWIDRVIEFSGTQSSPTQPLDWPREGATCNGGAIAGSPFVPDEVAFAEFELAFILIGNPAAQAAASQGSNVKAVKAGSAGVEFFSPTLGSSSETRLPSVAHDLISCLFAAQGFGSGLASGVSGESSFGPCDFERSEGFA